MKTILITGGCGFVGSWLALEFKKQHPDYTIIAFDNLKRRGSELNLPRLSKGGVEFIHGDIRIKEDLMQIPAVNTIIDAAAEPSVLAGLDKSPDYLVHTNFNGTVHCLELAKRYAADFVFLSTSRVYPIKPLESLLYKEELTRFELISNQEQIGVSENGINEYFSTSGARSLYGATKLASELIVQEYQSMMGVNAVINRAGVITGPWQMGKVDQGVVVLWMARHFWKAKLGYFGYGGTGKQVRDILHIHDLYRLVDWQVHNMDKVNGSLFNVGGGRASSVSLQELTQLCETITGNHIEIERVLELRKADIPIYISDNTNVKAVTGWYPQYTPLEIMNEIFEWLRLNESSLKSILS
jgi:CDP-paratose 2-epimerase